MTSIASLDPCQLRSKWWRSFLSRISVRCFPQPDCLESFNCCLAVTADGPAMPYPLFAFFTCRLSNGAGFRLGQMNGWRRKRTRGWILPNFCSKINLHATKCACVPAYIHTFHTYLPACIHTCTQAYMDTWIPDACTHTCIHAYLPTDRQAARHACRWCILDFVFWHIWCLLS